MEEKISLSVTEAAQLLGVSRPTMYSIVKRDDFDAVYKVGSRTLIHRRKLEAWATRQTEARNI